MLPAIPLVSPVRRILLIDRDRALLRALRVPLERQGHAVAHSGRTEALGDPAVVGPVDLVVLDSHRLPEAKALALCAAVRRASDARLLLANGPGASDLLARVLDAGADVILPAPTAPRIALAQIGALIRRLPSQPAPGAMRTVTEEWSLDEDARRLVGRGRQAGRSRGLSSLEWRLLRYLLDHPGAPIGRAMLLAAVWGEGYEDANGELDLYVHRLRQKIEPDPAAPRYLCTIRGVGYQFRGGDQPAD